MLKQEVILEHSFDLNSTELLKIFYKFANIAIPNILVTVFPFIQERVSVHFMKVKYDNDALQEAMESGHIYAYLLIGSLMNSSMSGLKIVGTYYYSIGKFYIMGISLQKARMLTFIATIILCLIYFTFLHRIILFVGTVESVATPLNRYLIYLWIRAIFTVQVTFNLNLQLIVNKGYVCGVIAILATAFHYQLADLLINKLNLGIDGAGLSLVLTKVFIIIVTMSYGTVYPFCPKASFWFNKDCTVDFYDYIQYTWSYCLNYCLEDYAYHIFLAAIAFWISPLQFSIYVLISNIYMVSNSFSSGVGQATLILVSKKLVNTGVSMAKKISIYCFMFGVIIVLFLCLLLIVVRKKLFYIFVEKEDLFSLSEPSLYILGFLILMDIFQRVFCNILYSLGKQFNVLIVSISQVYFIQILMSIILGKVLNLQTIGIWVAITISYLFSCFQYLVMLQRINFENCRSQIYKLIDVQTEKYEFKSKEDYMRSIEEVDKTKS